jgi:hypothetical protein
MTMATVAQISEKISKLRSKIAVTEAVVLYLKTNYLPTDSVEAEMRVTRADFAVVPADHIEMSITDYVDYIDDLRAQLDEWENLSVEIPVPKKAEAKEKPEPEKKRKKEAPSGTARGHQDPTPGNDGSSKAG